MYIEFVHNIHISCLFFCLTKYTYCVIIYTTKKRGDLMSVSERLKTVRTDAGLSQKELAEKLGMPLRTYGSYERGERDISTAILLNICKVLNVSSDYLLGRDDNSANQLPNPPAPGEQFQLDNVYFSLAKQAQEDGVNPEDIRLAIETIKAMRNKGGDQNK